MKIYKKIFFAIFIFFLELSSSFLLKAGEEIVHIPSMVRKGEAYLIAINSIEKPEAYLGTKKLTPVKMKSGYAFFIAVDLDDSRKKEIFRILSGETEKIYPLVFYDFKSRIRELYIPVTKNKFVGKSKEKEASNQEVSEKRKIFSESLYFKESFALPIKNIDPKEYFFGDKRNLYQNNKKIAVYFHRGVDFAMPKGTPVYASNDGKILLAGNQFHRGNMVLIHHGGEIFTEYLHLEKVLAKEGQWVKKGDLIGKVGNTGVSTGHHLHWSFIIGGIWVNPFSWTNIKVMF
ncbi:MAG TPA: hypothetical protein DHW82_04195 [Spirochaetia bacterium]|nr:MAG: hypothetical protein A2Y41_08315 [Spirochaetes bacterium GWB1_36_13]HCL56194.1 hypothetical protein [Spirochaetia bacterium]